jgi:DNA-binding GntR family transcriptional regulator
LLHISRTLRESAGRMTIGEFNKLDRRIDQLLSTAAGEPFLEHTLRPLHTIFRRLGLIYHNWVAPHAGLDGTVACHLAMLDAVAARQPDAAVAAADKLVAFVDSMFDAMERGIDPALLDCNLALQAVG